MATLGKSYSSLDAYTVFEKHLKSNIFVADERSEETTLYSNSTISYVDTKVSKMSKKWLCSKYYIGVVYIRVQKISKIT